MPYRSIEVGDLETNCYLFYDESCRHCLVIDPGAEAKKILALIAGERLVPLAVVLTHAHPDHLGAAAVVTHYFRVPLWLHEADEKMMRSPSGRDLATMFGVELPAADRLLADGDSLAVGELELQVFHSPGHSPGSILLHGAGLLFTGDTLFRGDVGRTDLPGGSEDNLRRSLDRIRQFPLATVILPGHGPASVLEQELLDNPYL